MADWDVSIPFVPSPGPVVAIRFFPAAMKVPRSTQSHICQKKYHHHDAFIFLGGHSFIFIRLVEKAR